MRTSSPLNVVLIAILAFISGAGCTGVDRERTVTGLRPPPPGVDNFGFVTADVWRGARPTAQGWRGLADMGVKTVIDLQEVDESRELPAGVRYVPIRTSGWHADRVDTDAVLATIANCPKPVFVHCAQGRDRTGLAIGAYRLSTGMTPDEVIAELYFFNVNYWWRGPVEKRLPDLARAVQLSCK